MSKRNRSALLIVMLIMLIFTSSAFANEKLEANKKFNMDCLRCHGAIGLKSLKDGEERSLYINEDIYFSSIHGTNLCTSCHVALGEYPHTLDSQLKLSINRRCQECHADVTETYKASVHEKSSDSGDPVVCTDCHGVHNIFKKGDARSRVFKNTLPSTCTSCHDNYVKYSYEKSFHGKAILLGSKKAASCVDCHGGHLILSQKDDASTVHKDNVPNTCAKCHFKAQENFAKGNEHWEFKRGGPGEPMYWTLKFFVWLTVSVVSFLIIHIELELYGKLRRLKNIEDKHKGGS